MVVYTSSHTSVTLPEIDIYSYLFLPNEYNTTRPLDRAILIDAESQRSLSFTQVRDISGRLATGWNKSAGLSKGDVVAVFAPNQYDHALLYFSLLAAKCTISPGNPAYTKAEFYHQIHTSGAKALVTVPSLLPVLTKVCEEVGIPKERIFLFGDQAIGSIKPFYSLLENNSSIELPLKNVDSVNDVAFICFSSGTTGIAKGVMLTHRNFIAQMIQVTKFENGDTNQINDRILAFLPFFHIFGLTTLVIRAFYSLTPVVVMGKYDVEVFCRLVQKHKITIANIVPPVAVHLAKHPAVKNYDLSSLRIIGCGAAPLSREHIDALHKRIPVHVRQGYGMTETTAGCIYQIIGSTGVLLSNMEAKLIDEDCNGINKLGPDEAGELVIRGPQIMKGYLNNTIANSETFLEDGWMRTGDIAKYDQKTGEFYIIDRLKELIKYKGHQVAPAELEAVLMSHASIADCCVVGLYDSTQATEIPRAYVVLQGATEMSETLKGELHAFVNSSVAGHKKLRGGIYRVDKIPKSVSGKILRKEVREWIRLEQEQEYSSTKARL
ncbi:hypothetical protein PHYBLDRAFT_115569 [Phycomyces blakesleeanus NRRL 1555(-)]|uniref:Uncharacterized protein n=1 Tax=Phycomyces blakesleeanus (strain ATCC 8743b / DSM 1359 / FGSC 10004 / NBRC 33097 / NRRL 1555) TaxID=763407 RepID=A0A167LCT1_PHYB8|nr:hypothetical protein PHYBLDRAFT_115569 [Phycomyces blakesleeanus NRRL 1555(-)]OAD70167.1 hypothetical protein PHYBLDRAFT_115569 [Phycomyces blakesleeanus NRRL 1555(-)]|eukprot:XP_018288207.1 hypothetical protein PHYBLDRAFT_115569 [Phycomyces blakesleeanus NRRL 1555(-)]